MSKIIEQFLIPLFVIVSVLYAFNSCGKDVVELHKVYHHTTQDPVHLEKANISFYFSGDAQVQEIKNKKTESCTSCAFFFPRAVISTGECEAMVNRLNNYDDTYKVTITQLVKPTQGILLSFNVDPQKFAVSYDRFDSIGLQKGVVFHLYNKELLKKLEDAHNQPVLRTLWHTGNKQPCVAIDCGHGGADCGAIGYDGIQEKQICLAIGTAVGNLLEREGCSVVLTRTTDCDRLLDERTAYANNNHADVCISIHANYAANPRAVGVETFCLKPTLFQQCFSQVSDNHQNYVHNILHQRADYSCKCAQSVQRHVCEAARLFHDEPIDRKVKHSVAQMLLGAQMPAILIEVGFVSHKKEAALLNNAQYQQCIARGICDGILAVIRP